MQESHLIVPCVSIGQAKVGTKLGIIGIGGLGQFALQMALIKGCEVYATDVSPESQKLAEELGCKKAYQITLDMKEAGCHAQRSTSSRWFFLSHKILLDAGGAVRPTRNRWDPLVVWVKIRVSNINTYSMITKEIKLLGSNGGSVEDLKGVYDCFATGKMNPNLITIPFEEIDKGLEKLKNHEVKGRLVAVFE